MGIYYCCVKGCSSNTTMNLSLFRFPKDKNRLSTWAKNCGREDVAKLSPLHAYTNYRVCSLHFQHEMFSSLLKNKLKKNAVPTIFTSTSSEKPQHETNKEADFDGGPEIPVPEIFQERPGPSTEPLNIHPGPIMPSAPIDIDSTHEKKSVQTQTPGFSIRSEAELKSEIRTLKRKVAQQERQLKKRRIETEDVITFCREHFSAELANFIKTNL